MVAVEIRFFVEEENINCVHYDSTASRLPVENIINGLFLGDIMWSCRFLLSVSR
jgi:hypothetical protein